MIYLRGYCAALRYCGLSKLAEEILEGGMADAKQDSTYPSDELAKGKKVEKEHTSNPAVATEIAKDHLEEHPTYYTALHKMEKELES